MSVIATSWAKSQSLAGTDKGILTTLGDYAGDDHSCILSHDKIAAVSGYSVSTVRRHLRALAQKGLLHIETLSWGSGRQATNRYHLPVGRDFDWTYRIEKDVPEDQVPRILSVEEAELVGQNDHPHEVVQNGTSMSSMSDSPGLCGWSKWPPLQAKNLDTSIVSSLEELRSSASNMPNLPVRHGMSKKVRKESGRARDVRLRQEEADQDPVKITEAKIGESLSPGHSQSPDLEVGSEQRPEPQRKRKSPGPDTLPGLIGYWNTKLGTVEWGSALDDTNVTLLSRTFSRWKRNGATAENIRSMIDLYALDPGMRTPGTVPWKDFQNKRALLWEKIQKSEKSRQGNDRRNDNTYWRWGGNPE